MDSMEGTGNVDGTVKNPAEAPHPNNKETNQSLLHDGYNVLESHTLFHSPENDWHEPLSLLRSYVGHNPAGFLSGSQENFTGALDGKLQLRQAGSKDVAVLHPLTSSEPPIPSPCSMNSAGGKFEELTLKKYMNSNLSFVGCSGSREEACKLGLKPKRKGQWKHLFQLVGGPVTGSCPVTVASKEPVSGTKFSSSQQKDDGGEQRNMFFPKICVQKTLPNQHVKQHQDKTPGNLVISENCSISSNLGARVPGGIRTKVLSSSGFANFFVKNTLKGKGVEYRDLEPQDKLGKAIRDQNSGKSICDAGINSDALQNSRTKAVDLSQCDAVQDGTSLREWLKATHLKLNKVESLYIFKQILELVDLAHFQGIVFRDLRPSDFIISPSIHVKYVGSLGHQASTELSGSVAYQGDHYPVLQTRRKRHSQSLFVGHGVDLKYENHLEWNMSRSHSESMKHQKLEHMKSVVNHLKIQATSTVKEMAIDSLKDKNSGCDFRDQHNSDGHRTQTGFGCPSMSNFSTAYRQFCESKRLEEKWYTSPEELSGGMLTFSSNIYSLGVLLFEPWDCVLFPWLKSIIILLKLFLLHSVLMPVERRVLYAPRHSPEAITMNRCERDVLRLMRDNRKLFCCFESWEVHVAAMSDLHHRILPPNFLSENPKEAGFCLWLLHPEPSSRPKTREVLQSELVCEAQDLVVGQPIVSVDEEDAGSELLLHFLVTLKEQRLKRASKLVEDIGCIEADIGEVEKRHSLLSTGDFLSRTLKDSNMGDAFRSSADQVQGNLISEKWHHKEPFTVKEERLMRNINQLENAYFSMRSKIKLPETDAAMRSDRDMLRNLDKCSLVQHGSEEWCKPVDRVGAFFDGLCKYARYSKFEVRGALRNADLLNSANVICSLSFDRDAEYFAAAGVSKKIKIFEFGSLLNNTVDIHYPVIEMSSKSKLSCVCWNNYIKNYLASTDYDGVIQVWDASTGQGFLQYTDHLKRAWSADFSQVDPAKLASGSDDCFVKLWSINEENCTGSIRNTANVCCVQFSPHSSHLLAFGSADFNIYCYDLRNMRIPWCTLVGHGKAVSYVKFLDSEMFVSASTDNTLKIWDLNKTSSNGPSNNACSLTLSGHTNEKNFVGLSVSDGYIACGSETNEVYTYYRSLPMPITSHKFGSIDPVSGQETGDYNGQFVSSVCWKGKSSMVVAANSSGSIRLLQLV